MKYNSIFGILFILIILSTCAKKDPTSLCIDRPLNSDGFELVYKKDLSSYIQYDNPLRDPKLLFYKNYLIHIPLQFPGNEGFQVIDQNTGEVVFTDNKQLDVRFHDSYIYNGKLYYPPHYTTNHLMHTLDLSSFGQDSILKSEFGRYYRIYNPIKTNNPYLLAMNEYNLTDPRGYDNQYSLLDMDKKRTICTFNDTTMYSEAFEFYVIWGNHNQQKITYLLRGNYVDPITPHTITYSLITRDINSGKLESENPFRFMSRYPAFLEIKDNVLYMAGYDEGAAYDLVKREFKWNHPSYFDIHFNTQVGVTSNQVFRSTYYAQITEAFDIETGKYQPYFDEYKKQEGSNQKTPHAFVGETSNMNIFETYYNKKFHLVGLEKFSGCPLILNGSYPVNHIEGAKYDPNTKRLFMVAEKQLYCFKIK
jgi:hypothetical protein